MGLCCGVKNSITNIFFTIGMNIKTKGIPLYQGIFFKNTIFTLSSGFFGLNYCGVVKKNAVCEEVCAIFGTVYF